jgi:hypothetical protein
MDPHERRLRRVAVVLLVLVSACDNGGDDEGGAALAPVRPESSSTSAPSTSAPPSTSTTSSTLVVATPPVPVPVATTDCEGASPFELDLPEDFSGALQEGLPASGDRTELYHPHFHYDGLDGRSLELYHGNAWRLDRTLEGEVAVLGQPGWISHMNSSGEPIIDFRVGPVDDPCAYWAITGVRLDRETLLSIAATITTA